MLVPLPHLHRVDCQLAPVIPLDDDDLKHVPGVVRAEVEHSCWRVLLAELAS
jgi:hypothetical protein